MTKKKDPKNSSATSEASKFKILQAGFLPYVLIGVAVVAVYARNVLFDFSFLDDDILIRNKLHYYQSAGSFWEIFRHDVFMDGQSAYYRPLQIVSYWIDARVATGSALPFFATNVLLHLMVCILLYILLRKLVGANSFNLWLVLFFSINALFVHTVCWLPSRGELLLGVIAISTALLTLQMLKSGKIWYLVPIGVCLFLSLLTKESAIGLPVLLILLVLSREHKVRRKWIVGTAVTSSFATILYFWLRHDAIDMKAAGSAFSLINILENLRALPEMLAKFFLPIGLSPMPRYDNILLVIGCLIAIALMAWISFRGLWGSRVVWFAIFWSGLFLVPTLTFNQSFSEMSYQYLEHRAYVPFVGLLVLIGLLGSTVQMKSRAVIGGLCGIVSMGTYAGAYAQNYRNADAFFGRALRMNSADPVAFFNRGNAHHRAERIDDAATDYRKALEIYPPYASAANNLGILLSAKGEFDQAINVLNHGLTFHTDDKRLVFNRGIAHLQSGHMRLGCVDIEKAKTLGSTDAPGVLARHCTKEHIAKYETNR